MRLISASTKRAIGPNVKILAWPVSVILTVSILVITLFSVVYERINLQIEEYAKTKETEMVLNEKLNVLRQVTTGLNADSTVIAIPDRNPAPWVISQVRTVSQETEIGLQDLKITGVNQEGSLNRVEMNVSILAGDFNNLISFLQEIQTIAPVSTIDEVQVDRDQAGAVDGTLRMSFYWSSLPTSLPPINEPIKELTLNEREILSRVSGLKFPTFTILTPSAASPRETPFN